MWRHHLLNIHWQVINLIIHSFLNCIYYHTTAKKSTRVYQAFTNASNPHISEDPKKSRGNEMQDSQDNQRGKEGRKEGRRGDIGEVAVIRRVLIIGRLVAWIAVVPLRRPIPLVLSPLSYGGGFEASLLRGIAAGLTRGTGETPGVGEGCKRQAVLCGSGLSRTHRRVAIDISREGSSR